MNYSVRKNERIEAFSTMFQTKEEAQKNIKEGGSVTFVAESHAEPLGFPCGGYAILNAWSKPQELFIKEV